jgi:hypothetical protein
MAAFKYACFVSYCHGQYELMTAFIDQLKAALDAYLDPLLDEQVYIDTQRLKPGYRYDEALAEAICQSVCMVVVYSPKYERHEYCVREYEAMVKLEAARKTMLGPAGRGRGFIIPVILRGGDDVPPRIREHVHCADFSRFTLATRAIPTTSAKSRRSPRSSTTSTGCLPTSGPTPAATAGSSHCLRRPAWLAGGSRPS